MQRVNNEERNNKRFSRLRKSLNAALYSKIGLGLCTVLAVSACAPKWPKSAGD